jgi:hypothetical protein
MSLLCINIEDLGLGVQMQIWKKSGPAVAMGALSERDFVHPIEVNFPYYKLAKKAKQLPPR